MDQINENALLNDAVKTADTLIPLKVMREPFLRDLFKHAAIQSVFSGQSIFQLGAYDHQHIYLLNGRVELEDVNGEMKIISGRNLFEPLAHQQPRPMAARAVTDCTILRLDSDRVDRTVSWSQIADYLISDVAMEHDLEEDIEWMQIVLNSNLFLKVPPVNVEQIFDRMTPMVVDSGDVILRQGEIGDCCYFIKEGDAKVEVSDEQTGHTKQVADIHMGRCFGEDALVYETVRNATVTMTSNGVLMRLEKSDFMLLLREPAVEELTEEEIGQMHDTPIFIDVRTDDEYTSEHIAYSANIPLSLLSIKKRLLSTAIPYILYCDTGLRSRAAAYLLGKQGFNVVALKGGYIGAGYLGRLVGDEGYILRDGVLVSDQ